MRPNLLFDLDGTLTDPQEGILTCIRYALEKSGRAAPPASELIWCIGPPLHVSMAILAPEADEKEVWRLVGLYRERFADKGKFENAVFPGIPDLLSELAKSRKLFVATSKPEVFAKEIISHYRLDPYFIRVYGSELDGTRADKGDLIRHILARENLKPEETLIIGDREHDVLGAKKAGVLSVGITWGYGSVEELKAAGAHHVVSNQNDLLTLLLAAK